MGPPLLRWPRALALCFAACCIVYSAAATGRVGGHNTAAAEPGDSQVEWDLDSTLLRVKDTVAGIKERVASASVGKSRRERLNERAQRKSEFRSKRRSGAWVASTISSAHGEINSVSNSEAKKFKKYPHVPAVPLPKNSYDMCTYTRPNYGNSNFRGWQNCPSGTYQTGLYRDGCDSINCIAGFGCCRPKNSLHNGWTCYAQNMWSRFDRKGWHHCDKPGYFMNGWWKNSGNWLYHIENFHCCKPTWSEPKYDHCYTENWWSSMDRRGWSVCRQPNHFIQGIYRNHCNHLHCLEMAHCCSPTYPRPATDTRQNTGYLATFPGTQVQRGRVRAGGASALRDDRPGRRLRLYRGVVNFKTPFTSPPKVHAALSLVDTNWRRGQRVDVFIERVLPNQFYYRVQAWGDAIVYGVHIDWLAVGRGVQGYVKGQQQYLTVRKLRVLNYKLRKHHRIIYLTLHHRMRRIRHLHAWTLRHNTALRAQRKHFLQEIQQIEKKREKETHDIEATINYVKALRLKIEGNMQKVGGIPKDIRHAWRFANETKAWAANTLVNMKKKQVKTTNQVRQDMINVWNSYRPLTWEVDQGLQEAVNTLGTLGVQVKQECPNCKHTAELNEVLERNKAKCSCDGNGSCHCKGSTGGVNVKLKHHNLDESSDESSPPLPEAINIPPAPSMDMSEAPDG